METGRGYAVGDATIGLSRLAERAVAGKPAVKLVPPRAKRAGFMADLINIL